ncbi:hypothetical protein [Streptomyces sp. bgisy153]|uniref:hypothetical protein n=1 Tax=Streptomyces sp. bgisy153 TaxID=3413793 RepID=UPI003D718594
MSVPPAYVTQAAAVLARRHRAASHNEYGACVAAGFRVEPGSQDRARVQHQLPPIDFSDPDRPSSQARWNERRTRLTEYAATLETEGWSVEHREPCSGPILLAAPPPPDELATLLLLPDPLPAELRRIAELTELLHDDPTARVWWERAAFAGDQDAIDYLAVLTEEADRRSGNPA